MSVRKVILSLVILMSFPAWADEERLAIKSRMGGGPEPDHLLPVDPYPGEAGVLYRKALYDKLGLDRFHVARMLITPADEAESVIDLVGDVKSFDFKSSKNFSLVCVKADRSIWASLPENNEEGVRKPVEARVFKAELPTELGGRLYALCERMVLRSRYSKSWAPGEDGTYIEFFVHFGHGMIWNPKERKSPFLSVELGKLLMAYCEAMPDQREALMKEISEKAEALERYLNERPGD